MSIINQEKSTQDPSLYVFVINARHLTIRRDRVKVIVKKILYQHNNSTNFYEIFLHISRGRQELWENDSG